MPHHDTLILGAGAAGLFAAIFAARARREAGQPVDVIALDGAKKLGAKILVAGGGRCNVTHDVVTADDYAGSSRNAIRKVLRTFTVDDTVGFFAALGVHLKREETGKLFPTTDQARTVLDALFSACRDAGAALLPDHRVTGVSRTETGFALETAQGPFTCRRLILATGGKALPRTGSDGLGYTFARALSHTVTPTTPALVPLVLPDRHPLTELSGITLEVELALAASSGKVLHRQRGSLLFTHFGISGPAPMDISRHLLHARATDPAATLTANLLPDRFARFEEADEHLVAEASRKPRTPLLALLMGHFPERLARHLLDHKVKAPTATPLSQLSRDARRALARALVALPLPITRDRGYTFAEATAGGVPLSEIDLNTMASRLCPGLHLCGEILDVDGRIGGYNFQWAWTTGRLAGLAAGND